MNVLAHTHVLCYINEETGGAIGTGLGKCFAHAEWAEVLSTCLISLPPPSCNKEAVSTVQMGH
jgi:hypothetical protein